MSIFKNPRKKEINALKKELIKKVNKVSKICVKKMATNSRLNLKIDSFKGVITLNDGDIIDPNSPKCKLRLNPIITDINMEEFYIKQLWVVNYWLDVLTR